MATPWTRTQAATPVQSTGTGSVAPAWPVATTAGNNLFAFIGVNAPATPPDVNAPAGWTIGPVLKIASNLTIATFYISASAARSGTETFTLSTGTRDMVGFLVEESHSGGAGVLLEQNTSLDNGTSNSRSTGTTGALVGVNCLIFGFICNVNTSSASSSGKTPAGTLSLVGSIISTNGTGGSTVKGFVYENLATASGTAEIHDTGTSARRNGGIILAFRPLYSSPNAVGLTGTPVVVKNPIKSLSPIATGWGRGLVRNPTKVVDSTSGLGWGRALVRTSGKFNAVAATLTPATGARLVGKVVAYSATLLPENGPRVLTRTVAYAATFTPALAKAVAIIRAMFPAPTLTPAVVKNPTKVIDYAPSGPTAWGRGLVRTTGKAASYTATFAPNVQRAIARVLALAVTLTPFLPILELIRSRLVKLLGYFRSKWGLGGNVRDATLTGEFTDTIDLAGTAEERRLDGEMP